MQAVRIHAFGGAEVLQLQNDVARPVPAPDEILIKVYASGVNPVDWVVREGGNDALRAYLTLPMTLGWDAAGVVTEVGSAVTGFQIGDAVYGEPNFPGDGSYAEYCAAKASQFARKPASLSFTEAAAVPLAGLTAWTALFEHGKLQAGQRILIQGASGGVGGFAVQFAKAKGAYVIGTASAGNLEYVRQLGADEVIDYRSQKFEELVHDLDLVLEASPLRDNAERVKAISVLKKGGTFVTVNLDYPFDDAVHAALVRQQATGELSNNQPRQEWLQEITQLIDAGQVKVVISNVYPLAQVAEAHRESQTWHVRGKLVLQIHPNDEPA
ncbi:NADP-dependent oxidoreductase [Hymenobacter chitinivorans]|uniref:NADPH:quinone reductase-like Zn-dependent oxidoreductase n=1 Tax=Hymenobacter chitinivorans DSM 11115 TaxID=1121954 RepID=A0A2M9BQ81_9BACT|nr:NADP-dependent oxidoreductase [Hymenobacter chitinivorans]PJJ60103.1 NADPH:quinone reductase-like Zn-dependent oxidoreductase [Hymenobacter chitinivorans DSM 11115]